MSTRSLSLFVFLTCIAIGCTQNDGRYRAPTTIRPARQRNEDGRYRAGGDGRYRPGGDGRYRGGQDGRYVHRDVKYIHDDRPDGGYSDNISPYQNSNNNVGGSNNGNKFGNNNGGNNKVSNNNNGNANGNAYGNGNGNSNGNGNGKANANASGNANGNGNNKAADALAASRLLKAKEGNNNQYNKEKKAWTILHLHDRVDKDGYEYLYETENGILAEENGSIQKLTTNDGLRSRGFYEYTGDDGIKYRVDYVADDNGFVPSGDHIPTPPPYVKKLLEFLESKARKV